MIKITKRFVESLECNGKETDYFDDTLQGFGLRARQSGRKVYFVRHRTRVAQRRVTIGPHGPWTAEAARVEAQRLLGEFAAGNDPAAEKSKERALATITELGERFINQYVPNHLKPSTQSEYIRAIWPAAGFTDTELRCFDGTGGFRWKEESIRESSNLKR